jgi:dipeptidyl aminopeptidase/acylaminoacyl peptidase
MSGNSLPIMKLENVQVEPTALAPAELLHQQTPGQLAVRGDLVVYTLRRVVDGVERTELWSVPYGGGSPAALVTGRGQASQPRISPDGESVAFLHSDGVAPAQVRVLALASGTGRTLTDFPRGALDLAWSPTGTWLAVLAEDDTSAQVVRAPGLAPAQSPTAVVPAGIDWRSDGDGEQGWRLYPRHVYRVAVDGSAAERLTSGAWSAHRPRVDAHGTVHFLADLAADADLHPAPQLYRWAGGGVEQLTQFAGGVRRYHLRPDGARVLADVHPDRPDDEPARWYDVAPGGARPRDLLPGDGRWFGLLGDETDLHEWRLDLDDAADVTTASADGSTRPVETETGRDLVDGPVVCGALASDGMRRVAVLALGPDRMTGDGIQAPDVYALEAGGPRRLTGHGDWLKAYPSPRWERRDVTGPGGPITVHLLHPAAEQRGTVLALHGGPTGQWGVVPTVEALLLAAAGYLVAMPNIRGSIDRGSAWVAPLRGAWGRVDVEDVLAVCDELVASGLADASRLGVCGLSYGGFLTQWLIGGTDRFAAAVAENGVSNQVAAWANCDTGPAFCRSSGLGDPLTPDGVERLWACSPLRNVAAIRTPLLMLQGADDRICPASDNEQLFVALRALQREVEYVIYPEESHLMQATGRIDRRIDRHQRVLAWFDTHLAQDTHLAKDGAR